MQPELWRDVGGFEGAYQVSNWGRVRSLPGDRRRPRILKTRMTGTPGNDYFRVRLTGQQDRSVHVLVALAFIGPRPTGLNVCHNNGDRFDNRSENLRFDTQSENVRDTVRHGKNQLAARTHCIRGHEFTPENTARDGNRRLCRTCRRERMRRIRAAA